MISSDYFEKISGIEPSKELIGKIKATLEKEKGSDCSWEEASKIAADLNFDQKYLKIYFVIIVGL